MEAISPDSSHGRALLAHFKMQIPRMSLEDLFVIGFLMTEPIQRCDELALTMSKFARQEYARRPTPPGASKQPASSSNG